MQRKPIELTDRDGNRYPCTIGSDLARDGMYLEVTAANDAAEAVLEVFYSDTTNRFTVSVFKEDVCAELLEQALSAARDRLLPKDPS